MRNTLTIITLTIFSLSFGQKKKSNKVPPPIMPPKIIPVPQEKTPDYPGAERSKKCFVYIATSEKDSRVYVTENLFEYGWSSTNARMITTTYDYDAAKKKENESAYIYSKISQYVDGDFTEAKNKVMFSPSKSEKYPKKTFNVFYKSKSKTIDHLEDENQNKYKKGECPEPTVSI